jgi:hypothetical protein
MRTSVASLVLALCLLATPALAKTLTHSIAKVSIGIPPGWKSQAGDNGVLTLSDKKEEIAATFVVIDSGAIKKAAFAAGKELGKRIKKLKFGKEEPVNINGMKGVKVPGEGILGGTSIAILLLVVDTPNEDKDLMIITLGEDAKIAKHMKHIKYLFANIKPSK